MGLDAVYIVDSKTPRHVFLSARYKQSFAYKTMRVRLPAILIKINTDISSEIEDVIAQYGEDVRKDIGIILDQILKLKYYLENDYPLKTFAGNESDQVLWNNFLKGLDNESNTFFKACWLHAECYVYRRLYSFFENHATLRTYDYFSRNKQSAFCLSLESMLEILKHLEDMKAHKSYDILKKIIKLNLWGNRCDLSISSGKDVKQSGNPFELISTLDANIIVDESSQIIDCLKSANRPNPVVVEFICDNAGYELFTDFLLADYLIESKLVNIIRFNFKAVPWFISDATVNDFHWSLQFMKNHSSRTLQEYGKKWQQLLIENKFQVADLEYFWTSPFEFYKMHETDPKLYARLSKAHLVIFKGDLNYRKLIGDFSWNFTEPFKTCLRGFRPTNICSLRTVKADLICGLAEGQADTIEKGSEDWMITGEYGTIQFASKLL